jgi:hypothetical protein
MNIIAGLLRQGRCADEVMGWCAGRKPPEPVRFGCNTACPFLSGKTYKNCHGAGTGAEGEQAPFTM